MPLLPLDRQNSYRRRYAALRARWQSSGELYERIVRQSLSPATRLLDLGGGRGGLIEKIQASAALTAVLDPDLVSLLEHRAAAARRICGSAQALPYPAESFDVITASWLLEHLTDPQAAFAEAHRILRAGGRFIFLTPNALHPLLLANRLAKLAPRLQRALVPRFYGRAEADTFPVQYRANTPARLRHLCQQTGFDLDLQFIADPTYTAFNEVLFQLSVAAERFIPSSFKIHLIGLAVKRT